ncbi:hypothetical protein SMX51_002346 [Cronobacter sakazakii]|uniref:hypothetical protein n=1 Tax=Cronobacter sakazakii TaxID=28141 RepID=UPI001319CCBD|nr:hypothetical protein [Cronobacter sakazakii]ELY3747837.1 hypothetical protein [Cronobacter sakazakii]
MKKAWYKTSEAQANHTKGRDYAKENISRRAKSVALYILDRRPQTADRRPQENITDRNSPVATAPAFCERSTRRWCAKAAPQETAPLAR